MTKILFLPVSIAGSLFAGFLGRRLFEGLWSAIDSDAPPDPKHRDVPWKKVLLALAIEGAIFRAVRGMVDRASRTGFERLTGSWPGEERPEPT